MTTYGKFNEIIDPVEFQEEIEKMGHQLSEKYIKMYMKMADLAISEVSYCRRLKIGSLIVTPNNEMLMGYNGTPSGFDNCCELPGQDVTNPITLHGEANAMSKAEQSTLSTKNSTLFVTHITCIECAKRVIQSGIKRVFYLHDYRLTDGLELLTDPLAKIQVVKLDENYKIEKIFGKYNPKLDTTSEFMLELLMKEIDSLKSETVKMKKQIASLTEDLKSSLKIHVHDEKCNHDKK